MSITATENKKGTALKKNSAQIERELTNLTNAAKRFQPFYSALVKHGYAPDLGQFVELVYNRAKGGEDRLLYYLRDRTVLNTPAVNDMPIEHAFKITMIKLPDTCNEITAAYNALPGGKHGETILRLVYSMEIVEGEIKPSESAIEKVEDTHTLFGNEKATAACAEIEKALQLAREIQSTYGINIFAPGPIQFFNTGGNSLKDATINFDRVVYETGTQRR